MARDTLHVVRVHHPVTFPQLIPPGNYSGICHLSGDQYLVVDDKSPTDGFYSFTITFDSISGSIQKVSCNSFLHANRPHRDAEGIAWMPQWQTVLIAGEADNRILEYTKEARDRPPGDLSLMRVELWFGVVDLFSCHPSFMDL